MICPFAPMFASELWTALSAFANKTPQFDWVRSAFFAFSCFSVFFFGGKGYSLMLLSVFLLFFKLLFLIAGEGCTVCLQITC